MLKIALLVGLAIMVVSANIQPLCSRDGRQCGGTGICELNEKCISCDTYLPHLASCSKFYKCTEDKRACLMECPAGLEWNVKENICDWPHLAHCEIVSK